MTWTFDGTLATAKDRVRSKLGDVDTTDQLVSDEAIAYYLGACSSVEHLAAAYLADDIAAKFARQVNTSNLSLSVSAADRFRHYTELAVRLRSQGNVLGAVLGGIYVGGIDKTEVQGLEDDTSAVQPRFGLGQDSNPRVDDDLNGDE